MGTKIGVSFLFCSSFFALRHVFGLFLGQSAQMARTGKSGRSTALLLLGGGPQ